MPKPPSCFSFHPDRVGIFIFAGDFFKLKPTGVPQGMISVELQQAARAASAVALKIELIFTEAFMHFLYHFCFHNLFHA